MLGPLHKSLRRSGLWNFVHFDVSGFYEELSPTYTSHDDISSLSTHDCTIDSVDSPSPLLLNNSSPTFTRFPLHHQWSSGSDSVFSSTEESPLNYLRSKLKSIQEKSLQEMEEEVENGISFVMHRRNSDGDLMTDSERKVVERRKTFAKMKRWVVQFSPFVGVHIQNIPERSLLRGCCWLVGCFKP